VKLHPVGSNVKCPHCGRGPLEFISLYINMGDKYRCANCKRTVIHHRRKATVHCGLAPLLGFGNFGTWKQDSCQSAQVGVGDQQPNTA
jgi:DNA-directed RNA polymerase subunit RPC12/RpoP